MKADFTRSTFDREKHYSSVRMQQGRVQLDADWNEQLDITGHRIATEALDVIGPSGAPKHAPGFGIVSNPAMLDATLQAALTAAGLIPLGAGDLLFTPGRFYAAGILCECDHFVSLTRQPDFPGATAITEAGTHLVFLDVWERHLTALDDERMREVALGGPDTCTRTRVLWQIRTLPVTDPQCVRGPDDWAALIPHSTGRLAAQSQAGAVSTDPCILPPGAGYRRLENQLYRVEIHTPGTDGTATFKWSRDNGTVVTRLLGQISAMEWKVADLGRDDVLGFHPGDLVEITDDDSELNGTPGELAEIQTLNPTALTVTFKAVPSFTLVLAKHPKLRRWDGPAAGARTVQSGAPIELEDGVEILFAAGRYHIGEYWLIAARTATNDVEWPRDPVTQQPLSLAPLGIHHHYCSLGVVTAAVVAGTVQVTSVQECRKVFPPLTELPAGDDDLKRHNRFLHGWGVVCGLQVHCAGDRDSVRVEKGYALACDGSDIILGTARPLPLVQMAQEAGLLAGEAGTVCLTVEPDANGSLKFAVRADSDAKENLLQKVLEGTLLRDVYGDCLKPVLAFLRKQFAEEPRTEGAGEMPVRAVRRQTAALNLAVQLANQALGRRVFLSAAEHASLKELYEEMLQWIAGDALKGAAFCGILEGLPAFPEYPFKARGITTLFAGASVRRIRVSPDQKRAYAFGEQEPGRVLVFDLVAGGLAGEILLPEVAGITLGIHDVAVDSREGVLLVAAGDSSSSVIFRIHRTRLEPEANVVVSGRQITRLTALPGVPGAMFALVRGQGIARFLPGELEAADFNPGVPFNATGEWAPGTGSAGDRIFATAAGEQPGGITDRYEGIAVVRPGRGENQMQYLKLPGSGTDGLGLLERRGEDATGAAVPLLFIAVDPAAGTSQKRVLILETRQGATLRSLTVPTDGPVGFGAAPDHSVMFVSLAHENTLGRLEAHSTAWDSALEVPVQIGPAGMAPVTGEEREGDPEGTRIQNAVLVANPASRTLTAVDFQANTPRSPVSFDELAHYRDGVLGVFQQVGLRLLQRVKDCLCEHLLRPCPVCDENDVVTLACIEIRAGKVHRICCVHRREVITFPKLRYWLSAVPVIPLVTLLVEKFCCLQLPDLFQARRSDPRSLASGATLASFNLKRSLASWAGTKQTLGSRISETSRHLFNAGALSLKVSASPTDSPARSVEIATLPTEIAIERLRGAGVQVREVLDYDATLEAQPVVTIARQQFTFRSGDQVSLLIREGRVMMVTHADLTKRNPKTAAPANLVRDGGMLDELRQLRADLEALRRDHAAAVVERDRALDELRQRVGIPPSAEASGVREGKSPPTRKPRKP